MGINIKATTRNRKLIKKWDSIEAQYRQWSSAIQRNLESSVKESKLSQKRDMDTKTRLTGLRTGIGTL